MKVNYSIAFKINGAWTDDVAFKRDLYDDAPLDESLDTGIVADVPASLNIIPPFTLCRIKTTPVESNEPIDTRYYLTGDRETEAVTLFT
ncbi:MAG: hypothetical protein IJ735_00040 [Clostridia bacterium]|nr:hypothetical protein [Clostridia bacterium]